MCMCERDDGVGGGGVTMTLKQWQKTDDFPFNTPLSSGLFQVVAGVEMVALPCRFHNAPPSLTQANGSRWPQ